MAASAALETAKPRAGVYNITHPIQWTLDAVIRAVEEAHGKFDVKYDRNVEMGFAGFAHVPPAGFDITSAREDLGFAPSHDLQDSLRYWWKWFSRSVPSRTGLPKEPCRKASPIGVFHSAPNRVGHV